MHSGGLDITALTFTPYYSEIEDRIRLVINYADFANRVDFWITRAFLLKLVPSWEEYGYRYGTAQMEGSSESQTTQPTVSATNGSTLAVTDKAGILLETVDMTYEVSNGMFEICLRGRNARAVALLNEEMMMTLIKTIFNAAPHMQWGISPALLAS